MCGKTSSLQLANQMARDTGAEAVFFPAHSMARGVGFENSFDIAVKSLSNFTWRELKQMRQEGACLSSIFKIGRHLF